MSDSANGHPRDLLSDYLDDELGLEERASVDRHLAGCEDCRDELGALRRLARAFADESVPPVPVDLEARIGRRLDGVTVARRRPWRFAVPATIAATLGAIGLLVALQWREGRIGVPSAPAPASAPEPTKQELDKARPSYAPAPQVLPEQESAPPREKAASRTDALEKDVAATPEEKLKQDAENAPTDAPGGVPAGVVGGIEGGVAGGAEAATAAGARDQLSAADERRERPAAKIAKEPAARMQPASAPAPQSETSSGCNEQWSDSGLRATWEVHDVTTAVRELNVMARDVGGTGVWRGVAGGGPYVLAVPRGRFEEVFFALRARGVAGLSEPPAVAAGSDCAGISIALVGAAGPASPPSR
jgi:putative zinc finger protein